MIIIGRWVGRGAFQEETDHFHLFFNPGLGTDLVRTWYGLGIDLVGAKYSV
jgi:hypothetical protein